MYICNALPSIYRLKICSKALEESCFGTMNTNNIPHWHLCKHWRMNNSKPKCSIRLAVEMNLDYKKKIIAHDI